MRGLLLLGAAALVLVSPNLAFAQQGMTFGNEYSYVDESKLYRVLGEVTNESNETVKDVMISATFLDSSGVKLGESSRTAEYRQLRPGESSPFEIPLLDQTASAKIANYTLSATYAVASSQMTSDLEIVSSNARLDVLGTFYLNALAQNKGNLDSNNTMVVATLYDSNGRVIAIGRALAEASPGSSDILPGSEAPFGVVITDKLQTYKAVKYSLVAQSDQYVSGQVFFKTSGPGQTSTGGNQTQSGCLIATAAFGSAFAPQVQELRDFRDGIAMTTFAGSSFMSAFNGWYYSFSPSVAEYERQTPWARDIVRAAIQPLLAILEAASSLHRGLLSAGANPEAAMVVTGISASSLLSVVYLLPASAAIGLGKRQILKSKGARATLACCWVFFASLTAGGFLLHSEGSLSAGTSGLVLSAMATCFLAVSDGFSILRSGRFFQTR